MMRKKILVIAPDFKPILGGVSEYAWQFSKGFSDCEAEVKVVTQNHEASKDFDNQSDLEIIRTKFIARTGAKLTFLNRLKKLFSLISLALLAKKEHAIFHPDIVFLPSMYPFAFFLKFKNSKIITTFHGGELLVHTKSSKFSFINKWILRGSCKNSDFIFANSRYTKDQLGEYVSGKSKILVTRCGVDWNRFRKLPDIDKLRDKYNLQEKKIIFSLGRLDERKGFDTVLKCLPEIIKKVPNILYLVGGVGPMKNRLEEIIKKNVLQNHVRLLGKLSDTEVYEYMNICDVFAMPNRETANGSVEGFGIVFLEANCCCKPVVAGNSGGVVDAVIDEQTGYLVNPYESKPTTEALIKLLSNTNLTLRMGHAGRERIEKEFTWSKITQKTYKKLCELNMS